MDDMNSSDAIFESVKSAIRKLESYTNIPFFVSPIPEETELRNSEISALTGNFVGYPAFSDVSAVRFNFKTGIHKRKNQAVYSCDVWMREGSLNTPTYTVVFNPNSKDEISGGLRTVADLLLGKKTMLAQEAAVRHTPSVIQEKIQNDINEFIDAVGIENIKSEPLNKIYNRYSIWADAGDRRIIPRPQFNRVFKDFLVQKRVVSDSISTGHVYPGVKYNFVANPEEQKLFGEEIIRNKAYYKARMVEVLVTRMAQGDPEIDGLLICGQVGEDLKSIRKQIQLAGAQKRTVYLKEIYGFAGLITALWNNRAGKVLVFSNADSLFAGYNATVRKIVRSLLQKGGGRMVQYARATPITPAETRKKENLNFMINEAKVLGQPKSSQPKPNTVSKDSDFNIDDILDSEDKMYSVEDEGIPEAFEFKSKIIFLTNMVSIPEDLRDLPFVVEVNYTKEQALSLVEANLDKIMKDYPEFNLKRKREVLKFMRDNRGVIKHFDYDTFWHIAEVYMSGLKSWQRWGLSQLTGGYVPV